MYTKIAKDLDKYKIELPVTIVPEPTEDDYSVGFIRRYFVRISNDVNTHIFEISDSDYTKYIDNPFWTTESIKWRIAGPLNPIYKEDGSIDDKGVRNSNKAAIGLASHTLKNIGLYLPNLLQFYQS